MMKNCIFDWSGVVRDTVASQLWIVNKIFGSYGVASISKEEFRENWTQPPVKFYEKYLPNGFREEERAVRYRAALLDKSCPRSVSFPEVVEIVKRCKDKKLFLAVVSSDLKETLFPEIEAFGLKDVFDEIYSDTDDKLDVVRSIIKTHHFSIGETCFIGDSNHEIEVSNKLGIKSIAVTWGFTSEKRLSDGNPSYLVRTPAELEDVILKS